MPKKEVLGFWVIVIIEQVLGTYMIIRYMDPSGVTGREQPCVVVFWGALPDLTFRVVVGY